MKTCPICKEEMANPFGQLFYCKNECDLKIKQLPKMVSKVTAPIRALGRSAEEIARTARMAAATMAKLYPLRVGEDVVLTAEGNILWAGCWGSDGQVDPDSYPYKAGDKATVLSVDTEFTIIQMLGRGRWWIKLRAQDVRIWFEKV